MNIFKGLKVFVVIFLLVNLKTTTAYSQNQTWLWAQGAGASLSENAYSNATDNNGNVYMVGIYTCPLIDFGGISLSCLSGRVAFIVKYDTDGTAKWAKNIASTATVPSYIKSVCTDQNNDIYVFGSASNTVQIGSTSITAGGYYPILAKLDQYGSVKWIKSTPGAPITEGNAMCTDSKNNVYITGTYRNFPLIFGNDTLMPDSVATNAFVAMYNTLGEPVWAKSFHAINKTGNNQIHTRGITADSIGNLYIIGDFRGISMRIDSTILTNSAPATQNHNVFVVSLDSWGNLNWAQKAMCTGSSYGRDIKVGAKGKVFATGSSSSDISFNNITIPTNACTNSFVVKLDKDYNVFWGRTFNSGISANEGLKLSTDTSGNVYVGGLFSNTINLDSYTFTSYGATDLYLARLDSSGNVTDATRAGGNSFELLSGLSIDKYNNCYVSGAYRSEQASFGNHTLFNDSIIYHNVYTAKYGLNTATTYINRSENKVILYPNPVSNQASLRFDKEQNETLIKLTNLSGKELFKTVFSGTFFEINKNNFAQGMYLLHIQAKTELPIVIKVVFQ